MRRPLAVYDVPPDESNQCRFVVSKRPVQVLAGPSSSASVLYGFPAGRPFRLIGHEAGFAHIQDLKSSATGWIESTAVAETSADATFAPYAPRQNPTAVAAPQQNSAQQPGSANDRRGPLGGAVSASAAMSAEIGSAVSSCALPLATAAN